MRGELGVILMFFHCFTGSSPHAWGTGYRTGRGEREFRFIPTCVGNCIQGHEPARPPAVHPHMRGELFLDQLPPHARGGSSPHAWGTDMAMQIDAIKKRFIPTCVGNWFGTYLTPGNLSVHPHMRGELSVSASTSALDAGSSPHAWGTGQQGRALLGIQRFIPTCVGNWVTSPVPIPVPCGSSPHAWGTGCSIAFLRSTKRFIPTCVGNCPDIVGRADRESVHPHMRGELKLQAVRDELLNGSSPHAWGTVLVQFGVRHSRRFIPTCVGN